MPSIKDMLNTSFKTAKPVWRWKEAPARWSRDEPRSRSPGTIGVEMIRYGAGRALLQLVADANAGRISKP